MISSEEVTGLPIILHAPDQSDIWYNVLKRRKTDRHTCNLHNLSIITWNNLGKGIFESSLDDWGLPYTVFGQDALVWNNLLKFKYNLEATVNCKTDYIMGVDSHDAAMIRNPEQLIALFEASDCDLLFNSEAYFYPDYKITYFQERKDFQHSLGNTKFRYLNSGAWIGRRDFCNVFFDYCSKIRLWELFDCTDMCKLYNCDQSVTHDAFMKFFPRVKLDYECKIFLNIARLKPNEVSFETVS